MLPSSGRLFQDSGMATGTARLPIVGSLKSRTTKRLVLAERKAFRPDRSTMRTTDPRYFGEIPCRTLGVSTAILKSKCSCMDKQSIDNVSPVVMVVDADVDLLHTRGPQFCPNMNYIDLTHVIMLK